ncbi:bifunctional hydroxymethylpyrimidine kinase/phosphomethylpyrimidine kinase [Corynebacterium lowii]|uniref:Thiamine biosynthesis multifunctional protein ThiED n=1 Tax=Corynebacterium lowii TaxID=1544413 RepID=A0A0Q0UGA7_9CORY|nr:bifunctional hydroxymethylpyrimidine kinase/phosphomethylpyrimidine kinase [Corynebacterium lowii]KQB85709.1 Hydroxymethylpyrimidine/phosphomethylpyrimidine kinase [Corynebacterium lowii]MDP9851010.1 hydroxymethylpyrimidine kinase/phosphomethylpyrimidine kinase [Corynebacterium lowii]
MALPRVLTIAGTDPTGGAGIQADIKAISEAGGFPLSVTTALVAQNTHGVRSIHTPPQEFLVAQLDAVFEDVTVDAVKIGMLGTADTIATVANYLAQHPIPIVLDPVMVSTSGHRLLDAEAEAALREFCAQATVVTPNLKELAVLAEAPEATTLDEAIDQAAALARRWDTTFIVKGGHLGGTHADNALVTPEGSVSRVPCPRIDTPHTHGTGCSLSSSLATRLLIDATPAQALAWSTRWLAEAIRHGADLHVGSGNGPVDHSHRSRRLAEAASAQPWPLPTELSPIPESDDSWAAGPWTRALWSLAQRPLEETHRLSFIEELAQGTLPREDFLFYLAQDSHYLLSYSRTLARVASRCDHPEHSIAWARSAAACLEEEAQLHRSELGTLTEEVSPVTLAYTSFLAAAADSHYAEAAAAVLPCYWIYAHVGMHLRAATHSDHPYAPWLHTYGDAAFVEETHRAIERVEHALAEASPAQRVSAARAFVAACYFERDFFRQASCR